MMQHPLIRKGADVFWIKVPRFTLRLTALGGAGLADGSYLRAWPLWAAATPVAAALIGFVLGASHPGELYTYSLVVMGILGAIAALGAGLGSWALAGFALGDFFFARDQVSHLNPAFDLGGLRASAALLLSYILLAGLLVLVPILVNAMRFSVAGVAERLPAALGAAFVVAHVGLALLWTQSTPFLIRPVWSYFGRAPTVPAIEPLQQRGWILALMIGVGAAGRLYLEKRASAYVDPLGMPALADGPDEPIPWWAAVLGRTVFVTFLLSGLLSTWLSVAATVAALAAIFFLHIKVLPAVTSYVRTVSRVPLLARAAVVGVLAYAAGNFFVQRAVQRGSQSFVSLIIATLISLLFVAMLMPERPRPRRDSSPRPRVAP